jgi:ComF family protein
MLAELLDLVFAPACLGCDGRIATGDPARLVCRRCRARLRPLPAPQCPRCGAPRLRTGRRDEDLCRECRAWPAAIRVARSAVLLHPPADRIVHQLKYRGWRALAGFMADTMACVRLPPDVAREARVVVPVPTTRRRAAERGYNQAALLAAAFARATGRDLQELLLRARSSGSQTNLQPAARRANVAGAFRAAEGAGRTLQGAHVLLVDDVLTTGATAGECARVLVHEGARCVSIFTFARALDARRLTT